MSPEQDQTPDFHGKITVQLERILASPEFARGNKISQFLRYVVEQSLRRPSVAIKQFAIATDALGYEPDFDPQANPSVRIHARQLRRALDRYYSRQGVEDPVLISIPKGGYTAVFQDRTAAKVELRRASGQLRASGNGPKELNEPTIAVVRFHDPGSSDLSDVSIGFTESILAALSRFSGLRVKGPLVFETGREIDFDELHEKHEIDFLLQGWIRMHRSALRFTTTLIFTSNASHCWANTYDFDLEQSSLFSIEDTLSHGIAGAIADDLGVIFRRLDEETRHNHLKPKGIYSAFFKYNKAWETHRPDDWHSALEEVDAQLSLWPTNALLLALKSNIHYYDALYETGFSPDSRSLMVSLARKAVAIDPRLQLARYNLVVQNSYAANPEQCVEEAHKTVELNPFSARIIIGCAAATTMVGQYEVGAEFAQKAMALNPHYPGWYHVVPHLIHYFEGNYDNALEEGWRVHLPDLYLEPMWRAANLGQLGRSAEAQAYIGKLLELKPDFVQRYREYIKPLHVLDRHVEAIWDGLCKAGITEYSS